jgi:hypothetical protein
MDVWNSGKNRWRYKEGSDEKIIEIELTQGKVAQIDSERLEEIQKYKWWAYKPGGSSKTMYARTEIPVYEVVDKKILLMHVFLFPDIKPPRDHIDHDGLNNISGNIRSGIHGINQRNSITKSKTTGINEDTLLKRYVASWTDTNGRNVRKIFSWSKYPDLESAYNAAVLYKTSNTDRVIKEIETINTNNERIMPEKYVKKPKKRSNSGIEHITILNKDTTHPIVKVNYTANRKSVYKTFPIFKYNFDIDLAIEAAKEWLEEAKKQNPKKRKIDDKSK